MKHIVSIMYCCPEFNIPFQLFKMVGIITVLELNTIEYQIIMLADRMKEPVKNESEKNCLKNR